MTKNQIKCNPAADYNSFIKSFDIQGYMSSCKSAIRPDYKTVDNVRIACGMIESKLVCDDGIWDVLVPASGNADFAISHEDWTYLITRPPTPKLINLIWESFACCSHTALHRLEQYLAA